jgi:hypothetical protein
MPQWRRSGARWRRRSGVSGRRRSGSVPKPHQPAQQVDVARAWEATFPWAGPAPELVDLTGPISDDDEDT